MIARPFLMFQGEAEDAIAFWSEVVPGTRVLRVDERDAAGPGLEGTRVATVSVAGLEVMVFDSPVKHEFGPLSPSSSSAAAPRRSNGWRHASPREGAS